MYYSVDDIERDGVRVPAQFEVDVPNLEFLSKNGVSVEAGETLKLPLWLAVPLASTTIAPDSETAFVTMDEPEMFSMSVLNAIKTDPLDMDLKSECPVFTPTGIFWANLWEHVSLKRIFYEMIRLRAAAIYDRALAQLGPDSKYDEWERELYKIAHRSKDDKTQWLLGNR